jgi:hypothetical protein
MDHFSSFGGWGIGDRVEGRWEMGDGRKSGCVVADGLEYYI